MSYKPKSIERDRDSCGQREGGCLVSLLAGRQGRGNSTKSTLKERFQITENNATSQVKIFCNTNNSKQVVCRVISFFSRARFALSLFPTFRPLVRVCAGELDLESVCESVCITDLCITSSLTVVCLCVCVCVCVCARSSDSISSTHTCPLAELYFIVANMRREEQARL